MRVPKALDDPTVFLIVLGVGIFVVYKYLQPTASNLGGTANNLSGSVNDLSSGLRTITGGINEGVQGIYQAGQSARDWLWGTNDDAGAARVPTTQNPSDWSAYDQAILDGHDSSGDLSNFSDPWSPLRFDPEGLP